MKAALRKDLRGQRRSLSASEHQHRSLAAATAITRLRFFRAGRRVALYLPFDREADTAALIAAARRRGVQLFVPVISDRRHCRLRFYPLAGETDPGAFGISVPRRRLSEAFVTCSLACNASEGSSSKKVGGDGGSLSISATVLLSA